MLREQPIASAGESLTARDVFFVLSVAICVYACYVYLVYVVLA